MRGRCAFGAPNAQQVAPEILSYRAQIPSAGEAIINNVARFALQTRSASVNREAQNTSAETPRTPRQPPRKKMRKRLKSLLCLGGCLCALGASALAFRI